jgi:hypothetical protein
MDTNIAVLLLLAFDFGAMPHCVPSEISYSRAFASVRGSAIRSVPNQSLSFFEFSVTSCSKFCLRGLLLTAKDREKL